MHAMKNPALILRFGFLVLWLAGACIKPAIAAPSCTGTASALSFGTFSLLTGGVIDSSSTLTNRCNATPGARVLLCISIAADPNTQLYSPRTLTKGSDRLAFNIYTDAARSTIWGAIGAPAGYAAVPLVINFGANEYYKAVPITIYGRVPSTGQTGLPAGQYNSSPSLPMTISYKEIASSAQPDCSSSAGMINSPLTLGSSATLNKSCRIDSASNLDFGATFKTSSQNVDSTAIIQVTCNSGSSYQVGLNNGLYASGTQRRMQGPGGFVNYEIYSNSARTTRWGNDKKSWVAATATGQPQALTAYGRVPPQIAPAPGLFSDTITITVSY